MKGSLQHLGSLASEGWCGTSSRVLGGYCFVLKHTCEEDGLLGWARGHASQRGAAGALLVDPPPVLIFRWTLS